MRPKAMQALASHTSGGVTINIYIHTDMTARRDATEAIARAMMVGDKKNVSRLNAKQAY